MLTEEALIVLAALGALGLLVFGVLQLVWPSRSKYPERRRLAPVLGGGAFTEERSRPAPVPAPAPAVSEAPSPPPSPRPAPVVAAAVDAGIDPSMVDVCFDLHQQRRFAEVVATAMPALASAAASPGRDAAGLWSLVGLAKHALGDEDGARVALVAAIDLAPPADRAACERQLVDLSLRVGEQMAARARQVDSRSPKRVVAIRSALDWIGGGLDVAPADAQLLEAATGFRLELWPAYEDAARGLLQRLDPDGARRLLHEALGRADLPDDRAERFRELLAETFSFEVGRLTAQAIRNIQTAREEEAREALERASRLLDEIGTIGQARRQEIEARLRWGYAALGERLVRAGAFEEAVDPLSQALRLGGGRTTGDKIRSGLVQALEGVAEMRGAAIRGLAAKGDRDAAALGADKLWALLRSHGETGLTENELSGALARARQLFAALGR